MGQPIFSNNYRVPKLCKLYLNITEIIMLTIIDLLNRMKKKLAENKCFYSYNCPSILTNGPENHVFP